MKEVFIRYLYVFLPASCRRLLPLLFLASCAVIVKPTGGPPDKKPPFPRSYTPDSAAVNFKSKRIDIVFDEFVQLKDLNSQLVISPPVERTPEIKAKGKALEIIFREPLKDSTTYTISFGNAIADIRESNAIPDFKYVFSTGPHLDSITLSGKVTNAFTRTPEKGIMVMLYNGTDDSLPYKKVPSYFGRTGANGDYSIVHIKPGIYKVFALKDQNGDNKYEVGELMGFQDQLLTLDQNKKDVNLMVFREEGGRQKLKRAYQAGYGKIMMSFAAPATGMHVRPIRHSSEPIGEPVLEYNKKGDSLTYWFVPPPVDSIFLEVGDNVNVYDTLRYKLVTKEKMLSQHKGERYLLSAQSNAVSGKSFDLNNPFLFQFSHPVPGGIKDASKLLLTQDTLKPNLFAGSSFVFNDEMKRSVNWKGCPYPWKENTRYHLLVLPGAFTDMYGFTHDTVKADFKTPELKYYGTLKLNVLIDYGHYLLQLLDDKDNILREEKMDGRHEFLFEYLSPMNYRIRLVTDVNNNGKWDTGDYGRKLQPEPVIYYKDPITIRSNWDQETVWTIR